MNNPRLEIAAMALQGLLAGPRRLAEIKGFAAVSVDFADALLARLAETAPEADENEAHETEIAYAAADRLIDAKYDGEGVELSETVKAAIERLYASVGPEGPAVSSWEQAFDIARTAIATDRAVRPPIQPVQAVPREPTEAMYHAGNAEYHPDTIWRRMVAAAPPCPGMKEDE